MTIKIFLTILIPVPFAELGDKTQLATLLFATDKENSKLMVFFLPWQHLLLQPGLL